MTFFEGRRAAADEHDDENDEIDGEPQSAYLGGVVPVEVVVGRSETAAVAVRSIVAYPDGFELRLVLWVRQPPAGGRRRRHPPWEPIMIHPSLLDAGEELPAELLRFGIEFPDGASVTNLDPQPWDLPPEASPRPHGMESHSGGGSETFYEQDWWVWPVPGPGVLTLVCEWPAYDIGESRHELDADEIRRAADRAQRVWPDLGGPSHLGYSQGTHHLRTSHSRTTTRPDAEP